jgi:hypothetical protein
MFAQWWANYPIEAELYFANYWFVDTQSHENIFQKATRNLAESAVDQVNLVLFELYHRECRLPSARPQSERNIIIISPIRSEMNTHRSTRRSHSGRSGNGVTGHFVP